MPGFVLGFRGHGRAELAGRVLPATALDVIRTASELAHRDRPGGRRRVETKKTSPASGRSGFGRSAPASCAARRSWRSSTGADRAPGD
ncbi:MAG: hypothetical protein MZV64_70765 [Ignavibacteriales bacterium]|nr:hypothetical protein [Ignavibacteriales bacterium]